MTPSWPTLASLIATGIPITFFALAALGAPRIAPLRRAKRACDLAAVLAAIVVASVVWLPIPSGVGLSGLVRLDTVTAVMLALVCAIAVVIVRYAGTYLQGDPGLPRFSRALLATLGTVTTVIVSNNLAVMALAWMATGFALHQLLTYYPDRTQALVAAHKKFILGRLADLCVLVALALVGFAVGSLDLDVVSAWVRNQSSLPVSVHAAAVLLVVAVALRSGQVPFHGWLTQVMEAPTPVSALLHAGVVNIGGFLLIRLSPLMAHAPAAQALLVIIGMTTVIVAALVMSVGVSVKASLSWSTCAQMGFMLVQCGLGAWHLALLHLVAHSLYKAHAFLSAGSTVEQWRIHAVVSHRPPRATDLFFAAMAAVVCVAAIGWAASSAFGVTIPHLWPVSIILGVALAPPIARVASCGWWPLSVVAVIGTGVTLLHVSGHAVANHLLPAELTPNLAHARWVAVCVGFVGLFGLQVVLQAFPCSGLARALRPRLTAGLHLDAFFTRMTFRLWPPRLPPKATTTMTMTIGKTVEA